MNDIQEKIADIQSHAKEIQAAVQLGVGQYNVIMDAYQQRKIEACVREFRKFYRVRGRIALNSIEHMLQNRIENDIASAITQLSTEKIHLSFASKILHTINQELPIYDRFVAKFFNFRRHYNNTDYNQKREEAVSIYQTLCSLYQNRNKNGLSALVEIFNSYFPQYQHFTDTKKIDFMIWGWGRY